MIKSIEGIYENGEIRIDQSVLMKNGTQVLIVFSDSTEPDEELRKHPAGSRLIPLAKTADQEFEDFEISLETKEAYERILSGTDPDKQGTSASAFFSLEPIDIGYTDANIIDGIIGGTEK